MDSFNLLNRGSVKLYIVRVPITFLKCQLQLFAAFFQITSNIYVENLKRLNQNNSLLSENANLGLQTMGSP